MTTDQTDSDVSRLRLVLPPLPDSPTDPIQGHGEPWELCPTCYPEAGRDADPDCRTCRGAGVLDAAGQPFWAPEPFDSWTPAKLVALAAASRNRSVDTEPQPDPAPPAAAKPQRLTQRDILAKLLEARAGGGSKSAAVTIGRSARGVVTWELTATTDPDDLAHLQAAVDAAIVQHDRLADLYPMDGASDA